MKASFMCNWRSPIQGEKWGLAESALVEALNKGGLDDEADNWLLLGIALAQGSKNMTLPSRRSAKPAMMMMSPLTHFAGFAPLNGV